MVGASNSGEDISREVAGVASRVHLSARSWKGGAEAEGAPFGERANIWRYTAEIQTSILCVCVLLCGSDRHTGIRQIRNSPRPYLPALSLCLHPGTRFPPSSLPMDSQSSPMVHASAPWTR